MSENQNHTCPNCEQEFDKEYAFCPHCGQKNKKQRIGLRNFISDYLSANFNFESKILLTLKLLLFKPAFLTKEYFEGRQTKYLPPIRLYLFISLAYFFVFSIGLPSTSEFINDNDNDEVIDTTATINEPENGFQIDSTDLNFYFGNSSDKPSDTSLNTMEQYLQNKFDLLNSKVGEAQLYENIKKYISTGMFLLLPFVALIFSLLFFRKKVYIENLFFTVHLQSAIFIIGLVFSIIQLFFDTAWITIIEFLIIIFITFLWIKNYYELRTAQAIGKQLLFYLAYVILFIIYLISLFFISIILL